MPAYTVFQEAETAQVDAESIIATMREPLLVLDENLYVVSANRAYHDTFGVLPTDVNNRLFYELGARQWDNPELRRLLDTLLLCRTGFQDFEVSRLFPFIGHRTMRLNARTLHRPDDTPLPGSNRTGMLLLAIEDVTDQQHAANALLHSELRYRRLFEAARDGILLLDVDSGAITDANPFIAELLGYTREELFGKELWQIGLFADQKASQLAFRMLQDRSYIRYENLPLQTRGGERREVEFVSNVYAEGDRNVIQCNIRDITERKRNEKAQEAALAREQYIAATLQRPLTVGVAEDAFPGLLVVNLYAPASSEALVGGDFYDAFALSGERVALAVADTLGKGISAAARTMQIKDVLRAFARESPPSPVDVVARLNRFACGTPRFDDQDDDRFTCLALAFLDPTTGEGEVVSAGCEPPVLLRADGSAEFLSSATAGLPLGIMADETYTVVPVRLHPGDTLLMMTDGISEAHTPRIRTDKVSPEGNAFLGIEGAVAIARQCRDTHTLRGMGEAILDGARSFAGGALHDDACILLVRLHTAKAGTTEVPAAD
jgi:PAS domain S-box-containing protein